VAVECLRGKKNLEIAEQLKISVETVNKHLDKVYQKAGVRGRAELASRLLDWNDVALGILKHDARAKACVAK
jgi:DNA-binding CsgD family transcriptional regulator